MEISSAINNSPNFGMAHKPDALIDVMKGIQTGRKISNITKKLTEQSRILDGQKRDIITRVTSHSAKKGKVVQKIVADVVDLKTGLKTEDVITQKVSSRRPDASINAYLGRIWGNINSHERKISKDTGSIIQSLKKEVPKKPRGATTKLEGAIAENTKDVLTNAFSKLF